MKIVVTGAAGFIGSHLTERLLRLGYEVVGLDNFNPYYNVDFKRHTAKGLVEQGADIFAVELGRDDTLPLIEGAEAIFHLAAQPGNHPGITFDDYVRCNITATQHLLHACEHLGTVKAFLNIATSSIYGRDATKEETVAPEPVSAYGVTKLAAEQLVLAKHRDEGFPACSFRIFSVYGERERPDKLYPKAIQALANDTPLTLYRGAEAHLRSYTYVGDIVDGMILTLQQFDKANGEIFNLGTDTAITTGEGLAIVEDIFGQKLKYTILPPRSGEQQATHARIGKARRLLGYTPTTTPRQGLERTVDWYRREVHGKLRWAV